MYSPKRIFVTGGNGFIGSAFVKRLLRDESVELVITYDKVTYCSKPHPLLHPEKFENNSKHVFVKGDICDQYMVQKTLDEYGVDTIVHLAAETHVDNSFEHSLIFTKTNVLGTHVLLQCAMERKKRIKKFVHVSTDEVYGESCKDEAFTESSTLNPTNPYAATKVGAEALVKSYISSFGLPCVITRGNNVYGPEQFPEKVIPKFICRLLDGNRVPVHGEGNSMRHFLYVDDTAEALYTILTRGSVGEIYNIAAPEEIKIRDLALRLIKIIFPNSNPENFIEHVDDRLFNDCRYFIDASNLESLGWKPSISLEEGLKMTIQWYKDYRNLCWWWEDKMSKALKAHPHIEE